MDWPEAPESDLSTSGHVYLFQEGRKRVPDGDHELLGHFKRAKLQGFEPVMEADEGIKMSSLQILKEQKIEILGNQNEEVGTSKTTEATTRMLLDKLVHMPMDHNLLRSDVTLQEHVVEKNSYKSDLVALDVDLNDPFYPYKKLGQVESADPSECGSTTGPIEINESMRKWNEMKQNGFVSTFQVKSLIPLAQKFKPTKKNNENIKKKVDTTRRKQSNMHTMVSASSQILSGLNPGIIKHVRNSKQVNSILKAMLQNEMLEKQETERSNSEIERGTNKVCNGWKAHSNASAHGHLELSLNKPLNPCSSNKKQYNDPKMPKPEFPLECDDDSLTLKLSSSATTMVAVHADKTTNADLSTNQEDISSLSYKALKRSKKRVKNAILKELPCIFVRDPHSKQHNGGSTKETLDEHLVRWKALFSQMEMSLILEENQLKFNLFRGFTNPGKLSNEYQTDIS
ncbi:hypothetical protein KSP40_PGU007774 [Platanthera guangdongensis]|uniref:Uncharacterized protein n=1 Tax=Platanthera guangdongensis TaxID=2320717 RepID=A0ABR2LVJ6_9ASPA